jgi:3-hydroxyacyl-CoA dehydrogenase
MQKQGEVAVISFDNPPVNALAHRVREGLDEAFREANADTAVKAIVLTGAGRTFSAGADITEFKAGMKEPFLGPLIDTIEASPKPVVAALNGLALGGGLELALGCHYRVAARDVRQLGLPEVKLGIIPGAGGTQRLPRIIGAEKALAMITSGNPIDSAEAASLGLVDKIADGDVVAAAVAFARDLIAAGRGPRRTGERKVEPATAPPDLFQKARGGLARHPSGPLAARCAIDAVEAALTLSFQDGLRRERSFFAELQPSPYARALQYAFFAERQAANIPDIGPDVKPRAVESVGIVGAGTMGAGIAISFLSVDVPVTLVDTTQAALDKGAQRIRDTFDGHVKRGRMSEADAGRRVALLKPTLKMEDLSQVDLVIEAVFENLGLKKEIFEKLDRLVKPGAILATNTSTLDVNAIAAATRRPSDVLGLHFFSPANVMRLIEVVRGKETAKQTMATGMAIAKRLGKVGVQAGVCDGFIGNRMLAAYNEEVWAMMLEGAMPVEIDGALEAWGMAMGPLAVGDLAGLDVGYRIRKERKLTGERLKLARIPDRIVEMGRLGQKTGAGYYRYGADRKREVDPQIEALIREEAKAQGVAQRKIEPDEIVERCLLRLANEGARILEAGIALRASDIDTIYCNGYGFPRWRGGPMWQADQIGLTKVVERTKAYQAKYGDRWALAPLIERLAREGGSFSALDAEKK